MADEKFAVEASHIMMFARAVGDPNPIYRDEGGEQGLAWDGCISDGNLWVMDDGDIDSVRAIFSRHPNGRFEVPDSRLSWRRPAPWSGHQRLLRVGLGREILGEEQDLHLGLFVAL